ncbi:phage integrase SAM-like domain-containing protein [Methanobrevibacter sp. DSM 116169]|uniref:phage integrase SAM-like domain-containing protein n=1 Tax=Methanobrevibacter sp. DSM 116169 TaxID=3242727 RepID=UPI0038FC1868
MYNNKLFEKFIEERNIKKSTSQNYESTLKKYSDFHAQPIEKLLEEAYVEENNNIPLKKRKLKNRLLDYRNYLLNTEMSPNTVKTYFSKLKTFYQHFEVEIPKIPNAKYEKAYETNYLDLPTKKHIEDALNIVSIDLKAVILFMSSSGTSKAETLSLKIEDFIIATQKYHNGGNIKNILKILEKNNNIVPTFYLKRIKTDKYYYTFCSPEATNAIVYYLKTRKNLKLNDNLFDYKSSLLLSKFQEINDKMNWGFKGNYRFFRAHTLRKFHASNLGLTAEYIDSLQGRSKNVVHETYIKTNPQKLKEIYMGAMQNVMICFNEDKKENEKKEEYNITINIFLSDKQYNIY